MRRRYPLYSSRRVSIPAPAQAQNRPGLLAGTFTPEVLASVLPAPGTWHPYPKAGDAAGWAKVPEAVRTAHVRLAEKRLGADWPAPKASVFLDFVRDGNRTRYEAVSFGRRVRLAEAVVAEAIEGKGRFVDDILDGIWTICEESFWGVPAHVGAQKRGPGLPDVTEPVVDLFAAETAMLLAWTDDLVGDALDRASPLVRERVRVEIGRRVLTPCLERDDFWWMGFGGPQRQQLEPLDRVELAGRRPARREGSGPAGASVHKILRCLDAFLASYPADGGCDEGPGYWDRAGGSLFDCLELLHSASGGKIDVFDRPLIKEIGRYIGRVHIAGPWAVNFADAAAKPGGSASLIFRYGKAIGDQGMTGFGAWLAREQGLGKGAVGGSFGVLGRTLPALFGLEEILRTEPTEPLARDAWFPGLQVMAAPLVRGLDEGPLSRGQGRAQRREPQPQRRRELRRLRRRRAGPHRRRGRDLHGQDLQRPPLRDLDHAVGLSTISRPSAGSCRRTAARSRPGRSATRRTRRGPLSSSTSPRLIRRRQGSRHGSAGLSSSAARESSSRSGTRSRRPAGRSR